MLRRLTNEQQTICISVLFAFVMGLVLPYLFHKPFRFMIPIDMALTAVAGIIVYLIGRTKNRDWFDAVINGCLLGHSLGASLSFFIVSIAIWKATTFLTGGFVFLGASAILFGNFLRSIQNIFPLDLKRELSLTDQSAGYPVFASRIEELEHQIAWANNFLADRAKEKREQEEEDYKIARHKDLQTGCLLFAIGCSTIGMQFLNSFKSMNPLIVFPISALMCILFFSRIFFASRSSMAIEADRMQEEIWTMMSQLDANVRQSLIDWETELATIRGATD